MQTLFLLPGLLCDRTVWAVQAAELADRAEVRIPDFWGYQSIEAMAAAVLARAPARFALAGHSMGARVALEILRQRPDSIDRLALLDTGIHPIRPGEAEQRQVLVDLARDQGMAALAARWLPPMVHPDRARDDSLMGPLTDMVCRATPEIFAGQVKALLGRPDARAALGLVRCPLLVACGRQDQWSPLPQHEAIAAAVPGATLAVIEDSGHMAPVEQPAAVTGLLRAWLTHDGKGDI